MAKSAAFGLASGLAVVILTLIVVAVVNLPQASGASATRDAQVRCIPDGAVADQGYGIARTAHHEACRKVSED
jgi:hypothetical protein